jgi:hypothetical protein
MSGATNEERLSQILSRCMAQMLADLGVVAVKLERVRQPRRPGEITAAFSPLFNDQLSGSFTLLGPTELFSRLHPLPTTVTPRDLDDWACEMVNQAVGRFRNRLAAYGTKVTFGVPLTAFGEPTMISGGLASNGSPILFAVDDMLLEGWLELEIAPAFRLAESASVEIEAALQEGSIVLF